jgi:hypothetical protein
MSAGKKTKINQLISTWPRGTVMVQPYLTPQGYDSNLMRRYREGNWVRSFGSGAYAMYDDAIDWQGGLYAVQQQLEIPLHVGGRSAIELLGSAHYVRFSESALHLFAPPKTRVPKWFVQAKWGRPLFVKNTTLLPFDMRESFTEIKHRDFSIRISSLERAVLEMLYFVPEQQGFDEAFKIMDNMMNLRPRLLQELLERCTSIKVKRLFLYMAEKNSLPSFEHLKVDRINLGTGKRLVVKGGKLDKKYLITVPTMDGDNG